MPIEYMEKITRNSGARNLSIPPILCSFKLNRELLLNLLAGPIQDTGEYIHVKGGQDLVITTDQIIVVSQQLRLIVLLVHFGLLYVRILVLLRLGNSLLFSRVGCRLRHIVLWLIVALSLDHLQFRAVQNKVPQLLERFVLELDDAFLVKDDMFTWVLFFRCLLLECVRTILLPLSVVVGL